MDVLYRKNIQLKQNISELEARNKQAQEEICKFAIEKESLASEKNTWLNQFSQMEERYQKELSELRGAHQKATDALEKMTNFQSTASQNQNGKF